MAYKSNAAKKNGKQNDFPGGRASRSGRETSRAPSFAPQEITLGNERVVVVPLKVWQKAQEDLEDYYDLIALAEAEAEMEHENEEDYIELDEYSRQLGLSPLRYLRGRAGMTQAQLARKAGLSQSYIAKIEGNERKVSLSAAKKIGRALKLPPEKIMT